MTVADLPASRQFWTDAIGLVVLMEYPGYVRVGGGEGFHLGLEKGTPGPDASIEITVQVDDVDASHRRLVEMGG
jgi:catechol 2,3-dioxygenase-like lactoylglutathione lyase family enzyme